MTAARVLTLSLLAAFSGGAFACDPVKDDAVSQLAPNAPGIGNGPLHRAGEPCLLCHDGGFGDPPRFTIAGTIFRTTGSLEPAVGVRVDIVDARGLSPDPAPVTNEVGNFYLIPQAFEPTFPLQVSITSGSVRVQMQTVVGGNGTLEPNNGSCASCHFDPVGANSPGHLALTLDDGGTPP